MRVATYYRYSTTNKQQVDNSEARQKEYVENLIAQRGWYEVASFTDHGESGGKDKQQLEILERQVRSGELKIDAVCIDSYERVTRRDLFTISKDLGWLDETGTLLSVLEYKNGEPFDVRESFRDLSVVVKKHQDHEKIRETSVAVVKGMTTKFKNGTLGWVGIAPVGYKLVRKIDEPSYLSATPDLKYIEEMFRKFLDGATLQSLQTILIKCSKYKKEGAKLPNSSSVKQVLRSAIYCGVRTFGVRSVGDYNSVSKQKNIRWVSGNPLKMAEYYREYSASGYRSIITLDEFNKVQDRLDELASKHKRWPGSHGKHGNTGRYKYTGLMRCANCGTMLNGHKYVNPKNGKETHKYICRHSMNNSGRCDSGVKPNRKNIREDEFNELLKREFGLMFMKPQTHAKMVGAVINELLAEKNNTNSDPDLDIEIQQARLKKLTELYMETGLDSLRSEIQEQGEKIERLKIKTKDVNRGQSLAAIAKQQWDENKDKGGPQKYLAGIYGLALIGMKAISDYKGDPENAAEYAADIVGDKIQTLSESVFPNLAAKYDSDAIMSVLRDMNLSHITVNFELGIWKGRPRQIPTGLSFNFLVDAPNYTRTVVVACGHQWSVK